MTGALAAHYAKALADSVFAPNSGITPQDAVAQLASAENLISGSKELQLALLSPAIPKARKVAVISKIADDLGLHRIVRNFLLVVTTHRRTHELKGMRQEFESAVDERLGWVRAEITSGRELSTAQREKIESALGTKLGKFIRADYKVDPAVLGGIRARVASREYDATLAGRLSGLRHQLVGNA
ncbi:MAG: ATP synthase F1 subunit delta [Acidobacteriaceae bacterium]|nr:ATP synthase F1 subunit delta [Acidobacteriaceae bacterium]